MVRQLGDRVRFSALYDLRYGTIKQFSGKTAAIIKDEDINISWLIPISEIHEVL